MKKIIIGSIVVILVIAGVFTFLKFNNNDDINTAMQAYNSKNYEKAFEELLPLAKRGNDKAQNNLGNLYANGLGIKQDYKQAVYWYKKSSKQGNIDALTNLAGMYQYGLGIKKDVLKAISMYEKAINFNNPAAFNNLGYIYIYGNHVKKDVAKGIEMITRASRENNDPIAQNNLGLIYYGGDFGIKVNYKKAFQLIEKSASQGYSEAQFTMSVMYYEGKAVPKDLKKSYFWSYIAYKNGYKRAVDSVQLLRNSLTAKDIKTEEEKADAWLKEHPKKSYDAEAAQLPENNS